MYDEYGNYIYAMTTPDGSFVLLRIPASEVIHMYEPITEDETDTLEVSPTISLFTFADKKYFTDHYFLN